MHTVLRYFSLDNSGILGGILPSDSTVLNCGYPFVGSIMLGIFSLDGAAAPQATARITLVKSNARKQSQRRRVKDVYVIFEFA